MKFLIVRLSSLGDIIHTLPMVNALRKSFPDSQIDWLVGKKGLEILKLIKEIDNVYEFNIQILEQLKSNAYDYIFDVQGLFKTGLISKFISGKKIIGFKNTREFADIFYDVKVDVGSLFKTKEHIVDLNLRLLNSISGFKFPEVNFLIPKISDSNIKIDHAKKNILIFPATTWKSKMWNLDSFLDVVEELSLENNVLVSASKSDIPILGDFTDKISKVKNCTNLIGKTSLLDLIYLIQKMDIVFGLDSGAIHLSGAIAYSQNKPKVYAIYGPTSRFRNGIYGKIENAIYNKDLDCLGCRKKECPLRHHKCMEELIFSQVLDTILV